MWSNGKSVILFCLFIITSESYLIFILIIEIYRNFVGRMQEMGRTLGMEIELPLPSRALHRPRRAELQSFFSSMKSKVDLVVVVIPDKQSYGKMLIMLIKY
jgi:hypothetical protein